MKNLIVVIILLNIIPLKASFRSVSSINLPKGYKRVYYGKKTFSYYLRNLPIKDKNIIRFWNGDIYHNAGNIYNIYAVIDKPLYYKEDLEQCADFAMRFWADYHKKQRKLEKLFLYNYLGKKVYYRRSKKKYKKYLRWHMVFSNSYSLKRGALKINKSKLNPGDMFVQNSNGGIGHVSIVMDCAENKAGKRIYLIGYGYMPAQDFHIEKADKEHGVEGWFTKEGFTKYLAEDQFKVYGKPVLRKFK